MAKRNQTTQPIGQRVGAIASGQRPSQPQPSARRINPSGNRPAQPQPSTRQTGTPQPYVTTGRGTSATPSSVSRPGRIPIGPTTASAQPFQYDQFREFGDSVMEEYQRSTAPEIESRRARVNQDLVNKGLTPGSEAYEREMDRFMRMENDLFQTAQRGALEQGLMAQNQAFGQSLGQANINAGLRQAQIGADASMYGADTNRAGALERLMQSLSQQESEFGRSFGENQRQFDSGMGFNYANLDQNQNQFLGRLGLDFASLGEGARQADNRLGLDYAGLDQNQNQFMGRLGFDYAGLGEGARQFDSNMGFNYAGLGEGARQADNRLGLDYAGLNEGARQFDSNLGFNYAGLGEDARQFNFGLGENARQFDSSLGQRESEFGRTLGQRESEFGRNFGLQEGQADFGNMMSLADLLMGVYGFNNQARGNDLSAAAGIVGGFTPNAPFVPINAGGAFDTRLNAQQARAGVRQGNADRWASGASAVGSALLMSDRNAKDDIEAVDNDKELESLRRVPVSRWKYKGDAKVHIGPMAQDFGAEVTDEPEARTIDVVDAVGSLISSVQALADRVDAMEANHAV